MRLILILLVAYLLIFGALDLLPWQVREQMEGTP
jgi:hypothetical protein